MVHHEMDTSGIFLIENMERLAGNKKSCSKTEATSINIKNTKAYFARNVAELM